MKPLLCIVLAMLIAGIAETRQTLGGEKDTMDFEHVTIELYNSEKYHFHKELPDRTVDFRFEPFVIVYGRLTDEVERVKVDLTLLSENGEQILKRHLTVPVANKEFSTKFPLEHKLSELPDQATVTLGCDSIVKTISKDLELVRVAGRVEDFSGNSIQGAMVIIGKRRGWTEEFDGGVALSDAKGVYEFYLPKGLYRQNWVAAEDWGTNTLENYFFELSLDEDIVVDFRIGQAEIAKLAATPVDDNRMFAIRFICWTINTSALPAYAACERGETIDWSDPRMIPKLKAEEVEVLVDGVPVEIIAFESTPVQCMTRELTPGWYIEAVLPVSVGRGKHHLTVVVHHRSKDPNENEMVEHGQAQYFSLMFP